MRTRGFTWLLIGASCFVIGIGVARISAAEAALPVFDSIDRIDLGGDGKDELVTGASYGQPPTVTLLREDQSVITTFDAYETEFRGGVRVTVADIDQDGKDEVITSPGEGGSPRVRIFDGYGKQKPGGDFFVFDKGQKHGVVIVPVRMDPGAPPVILGAMNEGKKIKMKVVDRFGKAIVEDFFAAAEFQEEPFRMLRVDLGNDGKDEIVMVQKEEKNGKVALLRTDGSLINAWELPGLASLSGVAIDRTNRRLHWVDSKNKINTYDMYGVSASETVSSEKVPAQWAALTVGSFTHALKSSWVVFPKRPYQANRTDEKYIEISLADQRLRYYAAGVLIDEYTVSTGRPGAPTPPGTYKIENKFEKAWSRTARLWMPKWMAFVPSGKYGLHQLPYWPDGRVEGETSLGRRVSGGCVRLGIKESEALYEWAEIGTPVYIN